jgi:drug/metabolite transporter (DMT)-like permease
VKAATIAQDLPADQTKGVAAAVLASSIWGGMYVISRLVLGVIPPITLVCIRMLVSAMAMFAFLRLRNLEWRLPREIWTRVLAMGIIGYTVSISAQFIGTKYAGAALGSLITTASPLVTVALSAFLKLERVSTRAWFGLGLGLLGVFLTSTGSSTASTLGILALIVAAVSWGILGLIGGQVVSKHDPAAVTAWASVIGFFGTLVLTPFELSSNVIGTITPGILLGILYLGVVSTAIAFAAWVYGVSRAGSVLSGIAFFAQPVVGSILGFFLLHEQLGWNFAAAAILLFVGAILARPEARET